MKSDKEVIKGSKSNKTMMAGEELRALLWPSCEFSVGLMDWAEIEPNKISYKYQQELVSNWSEVAFSHGPTTGKKSDSIFIKKVLGGLRDLKLLCSRIPHL